MSTCYACIDRGVFLMTMYFAVLVLVCPFQRCWSVVVQSMRTCYACIDCGVFLMTMYLAVLVLETLYRGRYLIACSCARVKHVLIVRHSSWPCKEHFWSGEDIILRWMWYCVFMRTCYACIDPGVSLMTIYLAVLVLVCPFEMSVGCRFACIVRVLFAGYTSRPRSRVSTTIAPIR